MGRGREKEMSESGGHINGCIFRQMDRPGFLDYPAQMLKARS